MIGIFPGQNYMGNSRSIDGEPSSDPATDALRAIALFFAIVSLVLAALVAASRHVWPEPSTAAIWLAPLYCAAIIFSWLCATIRQRRQGGTHALPVLLTLVVIALPCGVGTSSILAWIVGVLLVLICAAGMAEALRGLLRYSAMQAVFLFVGAPAFAVILFLWVNTIGYANVLEPEFAVFGRLKPDTLVPCRNLGNAQPTRCDIDWSRRTGSTSIPRVIAPLDWQGSRMAADHADPRLLSRPAARCTAADALRPRYRHSHSFRG